MDESGAGLGEVCPDKTDPPVSSVREVWEDLRSDLDKSLPHQDQLLAELNDRLGKLPKQDLTPSETDPSFGTVWHDTPGAVWGTDLTPSSDQQAREAARLFACELTSDADIVRAMRFLAEAGVPIVRFSKSWEIDGEHADEERPYDLRFRVCGARRDH